RLQPVFLGLCARPFAPRDLDKRPLELELVREARAALRRQVESRQADDRAVELVVREGLGLVVGLSDRILLPSQALCRLGRPRALAGQTQTLPHERDMVAELPDEAADRAIPPEHRLASSKR